MDRTDDALDVGLDLVHELHRLEDAKRLAGADRLSFLDERRRARLRRPVERPDHRRIDAHDAVRRCDRIELGILHRRERRLVPRNRRLLGSAYGDAHARLFDRDLADARLLDDADELSDPLGAGLIDPAGGERLVARRASADRAQQRLGVVAEEAEQQQLLFAGGEALGLGPNLLQRRCRCVLRRVGVGGERNDAQDRFLDRGRRCAEMTFDERTQLVHDNRVTGRGEHVEQRLRAEHLSDRRGQRRPADLGADPDELSDRLVEPRTCSLCTQVGVERSDEARRQVVLRGAHRDPRGKRRHRFVADVFVDHV